MVRVWITDNTNPEYLDNHRVRKYADDIVLVYYNQQLSSITGYKTRVLELYQQINNVGNDIISEIFSITDMQKDLSLRAHFKLPNKDWQKLKAKIIELNPGLASTIKILEDAQAKPAKLQGSAAIAYDTLWAIARMFFYSNQQSLQNVFDTLREAREIVSIAKSSHANAEPIGEIFEFIEQENHFQLVDKNNDKDFDFASGILEAAQASNSASKPPRSEEDIIRGDAQDFPNWRANPSYFVDQEWNRHAVRMLDSKTGKELFIFMAHRKGKGKSGSTVKDVAGADLIYASRENKSFVLVQYKLLQQKSKQMTASLELDHNQLQQLLNLCDDIQGCTHIISREPCVYTN